jgi:ketosteroid isomerase-like protein
MAGRIEMCSRREGRTETMPNDDEEILEQLNRDYVRAVQDSDVARFEELLAPDFMNRNPDGALIDRAAFLKQIARGPGITGLQPHDVHIQPVGDVAIIHARTAYTKQDGDRGAGWYTDTWARRDGKWLCVAAHVSRG